MLSQTLFPHRYAFPLKTGTQGCFSTSILSTTSVSNKTHLLLIQLLYLVVKILLVWNLESRLRLNFSLRLRDVHSKGILSFNNADLRARSSVFKLEQRLRAL